MGQLYPSPRKNIVATIFFRSPINDGDFFRIQCVGKPTHAGPRDDERRPSSWLGLSAQRVYSIFFAIDTSRLAFWFGLMRFYYQHPTHAMGHNVLAGTSVSDTEPGGAGTVLALYRTGMAPPLSTAHGSRNFW